MNLHETQGEKPDHQVQRILPVIEEAQRIEGGGPPKKIIWNDLPKPLRIFGYVVSACLLFMMGFGIVIGFLD